MGNFSSAGWLRLHIAAAIAVVLLSSGLAAAQTYHFSTLAGLASTGTQDGPASTAQFNLPVDSAVDASGNIYVADTRNHVIRKITPGNVVSTFAGSAGQSGNTDGTGSAARFNEPIGIAVGPDGSVYVAGNFNHAIRKITPAGVVTTLAGNGAAGSADGTGAAASFNRPWSVAVDGSHNVYVADLSNHVIRKITPAGVVTTLAGLAGSSGSANGTGSAARFNLPRGIAVNAAGTAIFVADSANHTIRHVTAAGVVTTLAGSAGQTGSTNGTGAAARFNLPAGLAVNAAGNNLYVAEISNHVIRHIAVSTAVVTTLTGTAGSNGYSNATGAAARFNQPSGVTIDTAGTTLFVADAANNSVRRVTTAGVVTHVAGTVFGNANGTGAAARFSFPRGVAVNAAGTVYVGSSGAHTLRQVTSTGVVTTLAGTANASGTTDGTGAAARFANPRGIAVDSAGTIYIADQTNHTIRRVTPAGVVTTFAGSPGQTGNTDGTGSAARFHTPGDVVVAPNGTIYVSEIGHHTIRAITPAGVVTTLAGTAGLSGSADGTGSAARFNQPQGLTANDTALFVADSLNHTIRRVTYAGVVTTVAGSPGLTGSTNGTGAAARFNLPVGVAVDAASTVFVADFNNNTIRQITSAGVVTTLAGAAGTIGSTDGPANVARFYQPSAIAIGRHGTLYITETGNHVVRVGVVANSNVVTNNSFTSGTSGWLLHGLPDASAIVSNVTGGVFQFYRAGAQAVVFQETGLTLPAQAPIQVQFQLGNSDNVRKRISVLVHDSNFQDLSVCTFFLPANLALTTYTVRMHTTQRWGNATASFYAATLGGNGGFYRIDNVTLQYAPAQSAAQTTCVDALAPSAPGGAAGSNLLVNGNFNTGTLTPWGTFGTLTSNITGGVFQFIRPNSTPPAGVVLQNTGQAMTANQILTATFQLGNSSAVRKRVTVLLHDNSFADLSACTFWLEPNQPLSNYAYRTYATQAWANATLSVYAASVGAQQWIRLDNVTLQRTPAVTTVGTECFEPGAIADTAADLAAAAPPASPRGAVLRVLGPGDEGRDPVSGGDSGWIADGFVAGDAGAAGSTSWIAEADATGRRVLELAEPIDLTAASAARLTLRSWLISTQSIATLEVSVDDGVTWEVVHIVAPSDTWVPIDVDLAAYLGEHVSVRLVFDAIVPTPGTPPDVWRIEDVHVDVD